MPIFLYKAKKSASEAITGKIEAQNQDEALEMIQQLNLVPVSIDELSQGVLVSQIKIKRVKSKEIFQFTKQLGGLIKSGVSLLKGLEVIGEQTKNVYFSKVLIDISNSVKGGSSFSASLMEYPHIFSPLYLSMIQAGEEIGNLKDVLLDISEFQRRQQDLISKVNSALIYPLVMLGVGFLTVLFILTFVLPKIAVIYSSTSQQLPLPTLIVMNISFFLKNYIFHILIFFFLIGLIVYRWKDTERVKLWKGYILITIPIINELVIKTDLARFTRTLELLLNSGLTLVRSIDIALPTITNLPLRVDLNSSLVGLKTGESLTGCLNQSIYLPTLIKQILIVAEESGSLQGSLKEIADSYESEINDNIRVFTSILEPLMILTVGLVVGFIVFSMLMPIFSMDLLAH